LIGPRVLVTRPQPGAERTAERLRAFGFEPVVMPLTETVALPHVLPEVVPDLVLATSPQAFRHLVPEIAGLLSGIPLRVTGKATAASARQAGFLDVKETGGDVSRLMASISAMIVPGLRILYLAGHVRRPELEQHLAARGASLTVVEVYDTLSVSYSTDKICTLNTDGELAAVLLTSVNCVARLRELTGDPETSQAIGNAVLICLSSRIADVARTLFSNPVLVASAPSEDALLASLSVALPQA
jgi:uroporphyrinogen-III synthase